MTAYVFDVGETLIDETGMWERAADACGVPRAMKYTCPATASMDCGPIVSCTEPVSGMNRWNCTSSC